MKKNNRKGKEKGAKLFCNHRPNFRPILVGNSGLDMDATWVGGHLWAVREAHLIELGARTSNVQLKTRLTLGHFHLELRRARESWSFKLALLMVFCPTWVRRCFWFWSKTKGIGAKMVILQQKRGIFSRFSHGSEAEKILRRNMRSKTKRAKKNDANNPTWKLNKKCEAKLSNLFSLKQNR